VGRCLFRGGAGTASAAHLLTRDEARRIAAKGEAMSERETYEEAKKTLATK
jgi:hypothetical protein